MAVATPILERNVDTDERVYTQETYSDTFMTAEEKHNSRISMNYARLINPESKPIDIIRKEIPVRNEENEAVAPVQIAREEKVYLVENARADADIFRADSAVNQKFIESSAIVSEMEEDENEDLRPTPTTIQYKTSGVSKFTARGKIKTKETAKKVILTKRDKIFVAVAMTVILALFVLIIVNSTVISGLHSEVSALQSTLVTAEETYNQSLAEKNEYFDEANLFQVVSEFAENNGMILR